MSEDKIKAYKVKCNNCENTFIVFSIDNKKPREDIECMDCVESGKLDMIQKRTLRSRSTLINARTILAGLGEHQLDYTPRMIEVND